MSDQWLCLIDGQKIGPVTFARLRQLAEAGRLRAEDYVRPADTEQWLIAKNVPDLIPAPAVSIDRAGAAVPPRSKRRHSDSLPVAKAIEPEVAAAPPQRAIPPVSLPKGKPLPPVGASSAAAAGLPFVVVDPAATGAAAASPLLARKKKRDALPLIMGGVAAVGVLAVVQVLVLSGAFSPSVTPPVANAETEQKSTPPAEFNEEEANPEFEDASSAVAKIAPAPGKHPLLKTVRQYLDITKRYKVSNTLPVQVSVTGLWLSASEQGEPYVASTESGSDKPARFLVVKVKIDNAPGAAPVDYQGWGDEAVLFSDADLAIEPLPPGKSPERIAKQRLEPGGSLVDTLVFPLDRVEYEKLRLALPHETVGIKDDKSFGLELPRHALGRGMETKLAGPSEPAVNAQVIGDLPEQIIDKTPQPAANPPVVKAPVLKASEDELGLDKLEARARELDKLERENK